MSGVVRGSKAYLIIFGNGMRYVEELGEFEGDYPDLFLKGIAEENDIWMPRHTSFSGITQLKSMFTLRGKKNAKKAWNKFLRGLKI